MPDHPFVWLPAVAMFAFVEIFVVSHIPNQISVLVYGECLSAIFDSLRDFVFPFVYSAFVIISGRRPTEELTKIVYFTFESRECNAVFELLFVSIFNAFSALRIVPSKLFTPLHISIGDVFQTFGTNIFSPVDVYTLTEIA
jgi:hypothetical protein